MDTELKEYLEQQFKGIRSGMVTKEDLKAVRAEMATKADLKAIGSKMATKDDLKAIRSEMATKDDLNALRKETAQEFKAVRAEMATKDDIKNMATKDDIKTVRAEMTEMREDLARQMGVLHEEILHKLDTVVEGFQVRTETDEELKKEINDTNQRVERLKLEFIAHKTDSVLHQGAA